MSKLLPIAGFCLLLATLGRQMWGANAVGSLDILLYAVTLLVLLVNVLTAYKRACAARHRRWASAVLIVWPVSIYYLLYANPEDA